MRNRPIQPLFLVAAGLLALGPHAWANTAGAGLPMEAPLQKLEQSFTGPIPYYGGIIGVVVTIIIMAFHGHTMGDFGKGVVITVMVVAFACAVPGALGTLGITGATIEAPPLEKFARLLTGPIPYYGGMVGAVVATLTLAFRGPRLGRAVKGVLTAVMAVAFACAAPGSVAALSIGGGDLAGGSRDPFCPLALGSAVVVALWAGAWGYYFFWGRQDPEGRP